MKAKEFIVEAPVRQAAIGKAANKAGQLTGKAVNVAGKGIDATATGVQKASAATDKVATGFAKGAGAVQRGTQKALGALDKFQSKVGNMQFGTKGFMRGGQQKGKSAKSSPQGQDALVKAVLQKVVTGEPLTPNDKEILKLQMRDL